MRDGTVIVDGDRIAWVGPRAKAPPLAPPDVDEQLGDAVLLPGLVNTHIHLDLAPFAGLLGGMRFADWLHALVGVSRDVMDDDARADAARWSACDQIAYGVTTLGDTGPSRASFDAMVAAGARGVAYLETFGPDPAQCAASFADLCARVDRARRDETSLVRVGVSPHAPYSVSDELYAKVADYARVDQLPVGVHIAESEAESQLVERGVGPLADMLRARGIAVAPRARSPVELLARTDVLSTQPLCIHSVRAASDDVLRLADTGASVAHCPRSNRWFGHGMAPIIALREHHVPVGLGTDSAASNDNVRLLSEARAVSAESLSPAERIDMATRGGALALGLGDRIGTLSPGKQADMIAFSVRDTATCDRDPARYVLEQCHGDATVVTIVAGVVRARAGRAAGMSDETIERLARHADRVRARVASWRAPRTAP
jgi:5-methylthioadenosine/S-adenosylhomocysteine deaminase